MLNNRYEFALLYDVENGNPNGDPDACNMPRVDMQTGHGLVTDVCIKRKVRNYVELTRAGKPGYDIYVTEGVILNNQHEKAYLALEKKPSNKLPRQKAEAAELTAWMCRNFYDIRTFGAVMTTNVNAGQVKGPVQFNFSRSIDPIMPQQISITRMAVTKKEDSKKERTIGKKYIVPYALYRMEGYVSAPLAGKTGFDQSDLDLLWEALAGMFEHDHSAARGKMATRKLVVFKHESYLGNAKADELFKLVEVRLKDGVEPVPRGYDDYQVTIAYDNCPVGVEIMEIV